MTKEEESPLLCHCDAYVFAMKRVLGMEKLTKEEERKPCRTVKGTETYLGDQTARRVGI